ncbi:MAG: hypothetical protein JXA46_18605 [Dehalococcoidales bacterium]|nr:hypothetical protein [Dehalococcoidales bacterium]
MKNRLFFRWLGLSIILLAILAVSMPFGTGLAASTDTTTSLTITKLDTDGISILGQQTVDYEYMEDNFEVLGDGTTHYWTQGPSYDPENLWDPDEQVNLKDKGAVMGTDLKDLCGLVGGMEEGDTVEITGSDGMGHTRFPYENVYTPKPEQGPMVICWYNGDPESGIPGYVPDYEDGMRLIFFPTEKNADDRYVFGNWDMHECLPESIWHFHEGYPSINGEYCKYVSEIIIHTSGVNEWSLKLSNGEMSQTVYRSEFKNAQGKNCHGTATYADDDGEWGGLPLWMLTAYVDDEYIHGEGCYNHILAGAGYDVEVTGEKGTCTLRSTAIARSDDYILADKLDGADLPEEYFPLRLVGAGLTDEQSIGQVKEIKLVDVPYVEQWSLELRGQNDCTVSQVLFEQGIYCHGYNGQPWTYVDGDDTWSGMPLWYLCGWADDENDHGEDSYNDELAEEGSGYLIEVKSWDDRTILSSKDVSRNSGYLLADRKNGQALSGDEYPLALVGYDVPEDDRVMGVHLIALGCPDWDLDANHVCDVYDVACMRWVWGQTGPAGWIKEDFNKDGQIDIGDVVVLGRHWGETW